MDAEKKREGALVPDVVAAQAAALVRTGRRFSLAAVRFPGMPLFPGHPPFQVLNYRTPHGLVVSGDKPWGDGNDIGLGYMSEMILGSAHSGAHVDALAHMTLGPSGRWHGGANADSHLSDFGPTIGDARELPPFFTRGVLLDAAGWLNSPCLPEGHVLTADDLQEVARAQAVEIRRWDTVLVRTGYMSLWPDLEKMRAHVGAGPDVSAARWLSGLGIVGTGSDTDTYEVQPAPDPGEPANPQPVHTHLLIDEGIYIMEGLYLEDLAAAGIYEFLFVALPLKIEGATGSMIDPLAIA